MHEKTAWEEFFDSHAPIYDQNVFTLNTAAEAVMLRRFRNEDVAEGRFDPLGMVEHVSGPAAGETGGHCGSGAGFHPHRAAPAPAGGGHVRARHVGGTAGNWGRRPLDLDEIEIMIVAHKTAEPLVLDRTAGSR